MSSLFPYIKRSWLERIVIKILCCGVIPKHIAFIMDGNRRYAKKVKQEKIFGHSKGFEKLAETLSWCRDLGITQTTLFTFSIENFKRPEEEVDYLMELFRQQANKVMEEFSKIEEYQICIRVYGRVDLLPIDVQKTLARMVTATAKFQKFHLNICFAYTAREEITNALNDLHECVTEHIIHPYDINYISVSKALYSLGLTDPDILIRTSGEIRLSDFLLWQSSFSSVFFFNILWPDFTIWHLFSAILNYQYQYPSVQKSRQQYFDLLEKEDIKFYRNIYQKNHSSISRLNENITLNNSISFEEFMSERESRNEQCHQYIMNKRIKKLYEIQEIPDLLSKKINGDSNHYDNHQMNIDKCQTTNKISKSY